MAQASTRFCPRCGTPVSIDQQFCPNCGNAMEAGGYKPTALASTLPGGPGGTAVAPNSNPDIAPPPPPSFFPPVQQPSGVGQTPTPSSMVSSPSYSPQNSQPGGFVTQSFEASAQGQGTKGKAEPKKGNPWRTAALIFLVLTLLFAGTSAFAIYRLINTSSSTNNGNSTTQTGNPNATATATVQPTAAATPTTAPTTATTPTPSPTPTTQATAQASATAADSTLQENKTLTCSTCNGGNDPVHFIINTITVDGANGRTVWHVTLQNVSGNNLCVENPSISLQISSGVTPAVQASGVTTPCINAGDKAAIQFIFSFVPYKGVPYTLTAHLYSNYQDDMPFDPLQVTF